MESYSVILRKTVQIVKRAAQIIKARDFTVENKSTVENIVTSSDIAVQEFLRANLSELIPSSGFLGEEKNLTDTDHEYLWIIDPIDGTTNYARGIYDCAISVALLFRGEPMIGVVYAPYKKELFTAAAGRGAFRNGKRIRVSEKTFKQSLFCTAMSVYRKDFAAVCKDIIFDAYMICGDFRRFGSCALELCYLAAGNCDLFFEMRVFPWDYAAAYLVLKEAGGILTGLNGNLSFDKTTALIGANNSENYAILYDIVKKYLPELPYVQGLD